MRESKSRGTDPEKEQNHPLVPPTRKKGRPPLFARHKPQKSKLDLPLCRFLSLPFRRTDLCRASMCGRRLGVPLGLCMAPMEAGVLVSLCASALRVSRSLHCGVSILLHTRDAND